MHVAIAKPEWGIRGGFEVVVDRIVDHLRTTGHTVSWLTVDGTEHPRLINGLAVSDEVRRNAVEYFRYLSVVERFGQLEVGGADVVICTQPGSWAVRHPHKLALFYHHLRVFYDLSDEYVEAGFIHPAFHHPCVEQVRSIDRPMIDSVAHFLVPSEEVASRLDRFDGVAAPRTSPFLAAPLLDGPPKPRADGGTGAVLCVSRHEWPKRTELVVAAAHCLGADEDEPAMVVLVGSGSRIEHVRALDRHLQRHGGFDDDRTLWMPAAPIASSADGPGADNVRILGHVPDSDLVGLYQRALCVVAPAYREDYGLTALEAMVHGKPVIACRDGGGLLGAVHDGENGLVVEPTAAALADAVRRLRTDPALRRHLSDGARATATAYTWERAMAQLSVGIEQARA